MVRYFLSNSTSVSSFKLILSVIRRTSVISATRRISSKQAISKPTWIATVRSNTTVRRKVTSKITISDLGVLSKAAKVLQPLIL